MSAVAEYLMRLICASIICAIVGAVEGGSQGIRRLIAGAFLMMTALSPVGTLRLEKVDLDRLHSDAQAAIQEGSDQAEAMRLDIISEACEAYIWNKAAEMGLELEVRLELDPEGLPRTVELTGLASPLERQRLTAELARELGLGEEAVTWNDPYQSSA